MVRWKAEKSDAKVGLANVHIYARRAASFGKAYFTYVNEGRQGLDLLLTAREALEEAHNGLCLGGLRLRCCVHHGTESGRDERQCKASSAGAASSAVLAMIREAMAMLGDGVSYDNAHNAASSGVGRS